MPVAELKPEQVESIRAAIIPDWKSGKPLAHGQVISIFNAISKLVGDEYSFQVEATKADADGGVLAISASILWQTEVVTDDEIEEAGRAAWSAGDHQLWRTCEIAVHGRDPLRRASDPFAGTKERKDARAAAESAARSRRAPAAKP